MDDMNSMIFSIFSVRIKRKKEGPYSFSTYGYKDVGVSAWERPAWPSPLRPHKAAD